MVMNLGAAPSGEIDASGSSGVLLTNSKQHLKPSNTSKSLFYSQTFTPIY